MLTLPRSFTAAAAVLTLASGLALSLPSYAAKMPTSGSNAAPAATSTPAASMADRVETRIKTLHDKLQITSDEEAAWGKVADAMRDNETSTKALIDDRESSAATQNAVDDLKSYQKIAQSHADGLQKVIDSFEPLYDSMPDAQKKNADEVFGTYEGHRGQKMAHQHHGKKSSVAPASTAPAPTAPAAAPQGE